MGVTNQYLTLVKTPSQWEPTPDVAGLDRSWTQGKTKYSSAKEMQQYNDFKQYSAILIDPCLVQPSSDKRLPSGHGSKYRDTQLDNEQRVKKTLEYLVLNGLSTSNTSKAQGTTEQEIERGLLSKRPVHI